MADNTKQFRWIVVIQQNLEWLFAADEVFVAGDLLWYPVEGDPKIRLAPDILWHLADQRVTEVRTNSGKKIIFRRK